MEWRIIPGFPDYEISEDGQVRRITADKLGRYKGRLMKSRPAAPVPYRLINLTNAVGEHKTGLVHILVALAFIGQSPGPEYEVAHWDGICDHNHHSNLRWATTKENCHDRYRHGTIGGTHTNTVRLTWDRVAQIRQELIVPDGHQRLRRGSLAAMAEKFGVSKGAIIRARTGQTWKRYI